MEVFHEGVRNEAVARSIADLVVNYGGNHNLSLVFSKIYINFSLYIADWQLFCGPILRLINEKSLLLNMNNLASIIVAFAEQHFTTGAIFVAKKILSVSKNLVRCLSQKDIDVYIDAILALQSSSTSPPLPPPWSLSRWKRLQVQSYPC